MSSSEAPAPGGRPNTHFPTIRRLAALALDRTATSMRRAARRVAGGQAASLDSAADDAPAQRQLARFQAITAALSGAFTASDVASIITTQACEAVRGDVAAVYLVSSDRRSLLLAGQKGMSEDEARRLRATDVRTPGAVTECYHTGKIVVVRSPDERSKLFPESPWRPPERSRSYVFVPVALASHDVLATLALGFHSFRAISEQEQALLKSIADHCAQALERARLYDVERRARQQAEEVSRLKDEFLATLSHELRTPLQSILGWTHILQSDRLEPWQLAKAAEVIDRNAKSQARLIEDILDVSQFVSGKLRLKLGDVDVGPVVLAAADTLRTAIEAKRIELDVRIEPGLPLLSGDADRLQQVAWNLLSNAVKFTGQGGRIEVDVAATEAGEVRLRVTDSGEGISPDFLPFVFDRFRQGDSATTRRHSGLGLGLAIVKQVVELHGGSVSAASEGPGRGTTMTVTLPAQAARRAGAPEGGDVPAASTERGRPELGGLRVLVVDDEGDALDLVLVTLARHGAITRGARSAEEALAALETFDADVLVSDIGMPGEDGYDLLREIRARWGERALPAVALTAFAQEQDRAKTLAAGFAAHIAKPVPPEALVQAVARLKPSAPALAAV